MFLAEEQFPHWEAWMEVNGMQTVASSKKSPFSPDKIYMWKGENVFVYSETAKKGFSILGPEGLQELWNVYVTKLSELSKEENEQKK